MTTWVRVGGSGGEGKSEWQSNCPESAPAQRKKVGWADADGSGLVSSYLGKVKANSTGVGCPTRTLEALTPHRTPAGAGRGGAGTDLSL